MLSKLMPPASTSQACATDNGTMSAMNAASAGVTGARSRRRTHTHIRPGPGSGCEWTRGSRNSMTLWNPMSGGMSGSGPS